MKRKRNLALLLALTILLALFTGCSELNNASEESTIEKEEKVELVFYIWGDEENYIKKVVNKYNSENKNKNVTLVSSPSDTYDDELKLLMADGAKLDIVDIRGISQVITHGSQGLLLDLTSKIAASKLDISRYGALWDTSDSGGRYFALPTRSTCWVMYYNKDLFDKAEMEYPIGITWDEYIDISLELTEKLKSVKGADGGKIYGGYWVPWLYHFEAVQQGDYCNSDDTSTLKQSLERMKTIFTNGSHPAFSYVKGNDSNYAPDFEKGNIAMLPNGEWVVNMLLEAAKSGLTSVNWEIAPMPISNGVEKGTTWGQFQYASITSYSKNPDEAFDFLTYLCGEEGAKIYAESGMIHAYSTEKSVEAYRRTVGKDSVAYFFNAKKIQEQPNIGKYDETLKAFKKNAEKYFLNEATIDEAMKNFELERSKIFN